jgi:hypothetical protein
MKAFASLLTVLLASQVLPSAIQPVHAQTTNPRTVKLEDESDGAKMRIDYNSASTYASYGIRAYSVEEVTETNKALVDGNQIKSKQSSIRYRAQDGRVHISYKSYYGNERIFIADPKAKIAYLIRPDRKDILRISGEPPVHRLSPNLPMIQTRAPDWSKQVTTPLGVKDVAGVKAAGTLTETFFPAGVRGNEKEMVETKEIWSANELPGYVYSRTFSPRDGEKIVRLENLKFGDVPESIFIVPSDYPIRDLVLDKPQAMQ